MLTLTDLGQRKTGPRAIILMDDRRRIAKAHKTTMGPWIIMAEGMCWLDKRAHRILGGSIFNPRGFAVRSYPEARKVMYELAASGGWEEAGKP